MVKFLAPPPPTKRKPKAARKTSRVTAVKVAKEKLKPADIGFMAPTQRTSAPKFKPSPALKPILDEYTQAFQESAQAILNTIKAMLAAGGDNEILAYYFIQPSSVPPHIESRKGWKTIKTSKSAPNFYHLFRFLCLDYNVHVARQSMSAAQLAKSKAAHTTYSNTSVSVFLPILLDEGLKNTICTPEVFQACFGKFTQDYTPLDIMVTVRGNVSSLLSKLATSRIEQMEREQTLASIETAYPAFTIAFKSLLANRSRWVHVCSYLRDLRDAYKKSFTLQEVNDAQTLALSRSPHLVSWQCDSTPNPLLLNDPSFADMVAGFQKAFPAENPAPVPSFNYFKDHKRSLTSLEDITDMAKNQGHVLASLFWLYIHHVPHTLTADQQKVLITKTKKQNKKDELEGWKIISKSPLPEYKALVKFITEVLIPYNAALQPVTLPDINEDSTVWPVFAEGRHNSGSTIRGYVIDTLSICTYGTSILLRIPAFILKNGTHHKGTNYKAYLTGRTPWLGTSAIANPKQIANGATTYIPNRLQKISLGDGEEFISILSKAQALKIITQRKESGDLEYWGRVCITQMSESIRDNPKQSLKEHTYSLGEHIAVIQLAPGGDRLATFTCFEKTNGPIGWKQIKTKYMVRRSDVHHPFKRVLMPTAHKQEAFVHIAATSLLQSLNQIGDQISSYTKLHGTSTPSTTSLNSSMLARMGKTQTDTNRTELRRMAAFIGRMCRSMKVTTAIIAGGGSVRTSFHGDKEVPLKSFYSLLKNGDRLQPSGHLANHLTKLGIHLYTSSAQCARSLLITQDIIEIDGKKERIFTPDINSITPGVSFHKTNSHELTAVTQDEANYQSMVDRKKIAADPNREFAYAWKKKFSPYGHRDILVPNAIWDDMINNRTSPIPRSVPYALNAAWGILLTTLEPQWKALFPKEQVAWLK